MSNPDDDRTERDIAAFNEVVDKIQSARSKYTAMLFPICPQMVQMQDYEEEPSDAR